MNKSELIDALTERLGDKKAASAAVEAVVDTITRAVAKGEKVAIAGFGVFEKQVRNARMARNPATGAPVRIKKTAVPKFRPGAGFKEVVSGAKKLAPPAKAAPVKVSAAKAAPAKKAAAVKKAAPAKAAVKAPAKKAPAKAPVKAPVKSLATKSPAKAPAKKAPVKAPVKAAPVRKAARSRRPLRPRRRRLSRRRLPPRRRQKAAAKKARCARRRLRPRRLAAVKKAAPAKKAPAKKAPAKKALPRGPDPQGNTDVRRAGHLIEVAGSSHVPSGTGLSERPATAAWRWSALSPRSCREVFLVLMRTRWPNRSSRRPEASNTA